MDVSVKHSNVTENLIKMTGVFFLVLAVFEIALFVLKIQSTNLGFLVLIVVGIGMFEKHSWSRTLGIILSAWMLIGSVTALFVYLFPQNDLLDINVSINSKFALLYLLLYILFYAFVTYILLRRDVKAMFLKSDK